MSTINTADFQKGMFINFRNEPNQIIEFQFVNPGKGSAFVRTKFKNIKTGKVLEFTYKSGETVEQLPVEVHEMTFLYKADEDFVFMDKRSFEQYNLKRDILGNFANFLKEGELHQIMLYDNEPLGMRFPKKVRLKVTDADDAVKGNTVSGAKKLVTLETGTQIAAPLFIKTGDVVAVDPETGDYLSRESQQ